MKTKFEIEKMLEYKNGIIDGKLEVDYKIEDQFTLGYKNALEWVLDMEE